jgi:serine protease Do
MNCSNCGKSNPEGAKFCRHCGYVLASREMDNVMNTSHPHFHLSRPAFITIVCVAVVVVAGGAAGIAYMLGAKGKAKPTVASANTAQKSLGVKDIIKKSLPSTVYVDVMTGDGEDVGSGFIYDTQGDVLTNAHVVEGASSVQVKANDGSSYSGTIIGIDPVHDIAAIRIPALINTPPLALGNSDGVQLGDEVVAIGNPLGLKDTVTSGMISGVGRDFQIGQGVYHNMFQISAPIAPGNSGGPLIDESNDTVIGVNSAGATNSSGNIGFAIPVNQVKTLAATWAKNPESQSEIASEMDNSAAVGTDSASGGQGDTSGSSGQGQGGTSSAGSNTNSTPSSFAESCFDTINTYYNDISNQNYLDAYNILGQSMQGKTSYDSFMSGFATTVSNAVQNTAVVSSTSSTAEITFSLVAGNRQSDGSTNYMVYHMDFTLGLEDGSIRIESARGSVVSH